MWLVEGPPNKNTCGLVVGGGREGSKKDTQMTWRAVIWPFHQFTGGNCHQTCGHNP